MSILRGRTWGGGQRGMIYRGEKRRRRMVVFSRLLLAVCIYHWLQHGARTCRTTACVLIVAPRCRTAVPATSPAAAHLETRRRAFAEFRQVSCFDNSTSRSHLIAYRPKHASGSWPQLAVSRAPRRRRSTQAVRSTLFSLSRSGDALTTGQRPELSLLAQWSVSSHKYGFGVENLRDGNDATFWQ